MRSFIVLAPLFVTALASTISAPRYNRVLSHEHTVANRPVDGIVTDTANQDSVRARIPLLDPSLRYGADTTISPCADFYAYVNGGWRAEVAPPKQTLHLPPDRDFFRDTYSRTVDRLQRLLDSTRTVAATTTDPTLRAIGTYYESCITAPELERTIMRSSKQSSMQDSTKTTRDSARTQRCVQRMINNFSEGIAQAFAQDLFASDALSHMETMLANIHAAAIAQLKQNQWLNDVEKSIALERLGKLRLRIGMPKERIDFQGLVLSPTDYLGNRTAIGNFRNQTWIASMSGNTRDQWKMGLLMPNAFYQSGDHAVEVPAVMFMPPYFSADYDDALNYAASGMIVGHEIIHSIAPQLEIVENPNVKVQMDRLKAMYTAMPAVDGWKPDGKRTFSEDIADVGGVRVAYNAWKSAVKATKSKSAASIDGYTPEQRFFVALARVWRGTWNASASAYNGDVHAPYFARVNGMVMSMPEFAKAFSCKEGDPMVLPSDKRAVIW